MKPEIKYSLWAVLISYTWLITQYLLGFHTHRFAIGPYSEMAALLFYGIAVWFDLKEKNSDSGYHLTFRKTIRSGLITSFIVVFLTLPVLLIYEYKINPLWIERFIDYLLQSKADSLWFYIYNRSVMNPSELLSNTEIHICLNIILTFTFCLFVAMFFYIIKKDSRLKGL